MMPAFTNTSCQGLDFKVKFDCSIDAKQAIDKEWLLTNNCGGYSASTISGCPTRRYHGLLVGALNPPVDRNVALSEMMAMMVVDSNVYHLSNFEFRGRFAPSDFEAIKGFSKDIGICYDYQIGQTKLSRSLYLDHSSNTIAIVYDIKKVAKAFDLLLRPVVGLRDFHSLQHSYANLTACEYKNQLTIQHKVGDSCRLNLYSQDAKFQPDPQWWFDFVYRCDKQRGQDYKEDLWTPGFFRYHISSPTKFVIFASLTQAGDQIDLSELNLDTIVKNLKSHRKNLLFEDRNSVSSKLSVAADQFVSKRSGKKDSYTILAGFPWFADWGRDSFISLGGLLLETGRFDQARSVLKTFAGAVDQGMIPNRFDDRSDVAHFNSVDASLWFVNAAFEYLNAAGDDKSFREDILPAVKQIIDAYQHGTRFGICADSDMLITAGDENTQLTWMDAKFDSTAFTPRYGKAVEVNALWYNGLCHLAQYYMDSDVELAAKYHSMADEVEASFRKLFYNEQTGSLNDCIFPDGTVDSSNRPNQIFAVSLAFSPLSPDEQKAVVSVVKDHLLTPFGLRTLSPKDDRYHGQYTGSMMARDKAYHQGTVWGFLMGPFIGAWLKVNQFSDQSRSDALDFITPLIDHMTNDACLGQVSEIFDGDWPHKPRGCFAQAWSVAELLRAYRLINRR